MVRPHERKERKDGASNGRYKGVRMRKWGKWVAEVRQPNSRDRIWLGSYVTAEEAARAYDAALFCLRGPSAMLNFPADPPDIPSAAELTRSQIQVAASRHARKGSVVNTSAASEVAAELKPPVVGEPMFFEEASELGGCSFGELSSREYYLAAHEGGDGVDDNGGLASGVFFEPPRMWSF